MLHQIKLRSKDICWIFPLTNLLTDSLAACSLLFADASRRAILSSSINSCRLHGCCIGELESFGRLVCVLPITYRPNRQQASITGIGWNFRMDCAPTSPQSWTTDPDTDWPNIGKSFQRPYNKKIPMISDVSMTWRRLT